MANNPSSAVSRALKSSTTKLIVKAKGLYTNENLISSVPDGALTTANNIVIDKDDIAEPRRGFKIFGDAIGTNQASVAKQLINYKSRLYRHYEPNSTDGYLEYQNSPGASGFSKTLGLKMLFASSLTSTGTTATFNSITDHGLKLGEIIDIQGASPTGYNGIFTVTSVPTTTQFTYTLATTLSSPASGNPCLIESTVNNIRESENGLRLKSVESNGNLYLTTSRGVKKIDAFDGTLTDSGVPKGLDTTLSLYDSPGFFNEDTQVGYRIVWGIKDANDNEILGSPSQRVYIANPGSALIIGDFNTLIGQLNTNKPPLTGTYNVIASNSPLSVLQTALNGTITTLNSEVALTGTYTMSATGDTVAILQDTYNKVIDELSLEAALLATTFELARTSQQVMLDITIPKGITTSHFYQIYRSSQSVAVDVIPTDDFKLVYENNPTLAQLSANTVSLVDITTDLFRGAELYTNPNQETDSEANDEAPFCKDIELYKNMLFYSNTRTKYQLPISLVGLDPMVSGVSKITISDGTTSFDINFSSSGENVNTGTALLDLDPGKTVAQRVSSTANSIVKVINRYSVNTLIYAYYLSSPDDPPGKMLFESRHIIDPVFNVKETACTIIIAGNKVSAFSPDLITPSFATNETKTNRIYYSKLQEPEAVPSLHYFNVGGGDNVINRIVALRDSLFLFSTGGVFRIIGDNPQGLVLSPFDLTTQIKAPDSLARANNKIYGFFDEGICTVSDTGIEIISRQIEDQLLKLLDSSYVNFTTATFGTPYQTDRKYVLFTVTNTTDTVATQCFIFNFITNTWVRWTLSKTCGIVSAFDDKLYFGAADTDFLEQERKSNSYLDHADRQHDVSILSRSNVITLITAENPTHLTCNNHGLIDGDNINIKNSNSIPSIDGDYDVTIIDENHFTINVNVTGAGNTAIWKCNNRNVSISIVLNSLNNVDVGDVIAQDITITHLGVTYSYSLLATISTIQSATNIITISEYSEYNLGAAIVYDYIPVEITWVPIYGDSPSQTKQFSEIHMMFDQYRGTDLKILVSSDVQRNLDTIDFDLNPFPSWGRFAWGEQPWGGNVGTQNIRAYIPQGKQRCRLINITYKAIEAFQSWRLQGISLVVRAIGDGQRTNKDQ